MKSDIRVIAETMKRGFEEMNRRFENIDTRFEYMNNRFEDMNKRFEELGKRSNIGFTYMNIIMGILVLITVLFKFI